MILDLFAGAGGWSEGLRDLGMADIGVELMPEACQTRQAAGHATVRADVTTMPVRRDGWDGLIASPPCQSFSMAGNRTGLADPRGELVWQIPRYVEALRPRWVACEQVPPVLPIWEYIAHLMRGWGYSVWTGVLNAADFGVPQTRKRAYLIGRLDGAALPPEPTHSRFPTSGDLFGGSRLPWVSMAQALGWDSDDALRHPRGAGMVERHGPRADRTAADVGMTVTGKSRSWLRMAAAGRTGLAPHRDPDDSPADTITGKGTAAWVYVASSMANASRRPIDEPAPTVMFGAAQNDVRWVHERPAATVVGTFAPDVIAAPGYRTETSRQDAPGSVRVTVAEAAVLQGFRPDYPWQGSRTKQYLQVGNAVCPPMAAAICRTFYDAREVAA